MSIANNMSNVRTLVKTTIEIIESNGVISVRPPGPPTVSPGDVIEWLADFEFVLDFGGRDDSPVSYGQFEFVSCEANGRHRVAVVAKYTRRRQFNYDIRNLVGTLDPGIIIDPN